MSHLWVWHVRFVVSKLLLPRKLVIFIFLPLQEQSLILHAPCISESCLKIKIKLDFYFCTSLWFLKRFYEAPQRSVKIKPEVNFFSSRPGSEREELRKEIFHTFSRNAFSSLLFKSMPIVRICLKILLHLVVN